MSMKMSVLVLLIGAAMLQMGCEKKPSEGGAEAAASAEQRCPHEIKQEKCPFCNPNLVESEGFCAEHAVAEALCYQCRPYLKAAFRAKGDWCKEHAAPESQCVVCHPELKEKMKPGAGHGQAHSGEEPSAGSAAAPGNCEHSIARAKCPFCTPSIVEAEGMCGEHGVAEALCVKCRPYLEAAFRAKGDWCTEHGTPESQCLTCNPELAKKPGGA